VKFKPGGDIEGDTNCEITRGEAMIVLIVKLRVRPGTEEECKGYMRAMEKETRKEPGCLMYVAHQAADDPTQLALYEQYKDQAALEAHRAAPYFKDYVETRMGKLVVSRDRMLCGPIS
jgi:quinol monooxygenase YgiN